MKIEMQRSCVQIKFGVVLAMLMFLQIVRLGDCQTGNHLIRGKEQPNIRQAHKWKIPLQLTPEFNRHIGRQGDVLLVPLKPRISENNFQGNHNMNPRHWKDVSRRQRSLLKTERYWYPGHRSSSAQVIHRYKEEAASTRQGGSKTFVTSRAQ
ncbi:hypothetical protein KP79_PYT04682 [Mizuhopecten yessoensis]|uniref:Uncharacterized protein n=1 Tax=Mizuhopecten yessoensis TaxID=6573 RepID=A0A210PLU9_MIZYE|nr:hypothetical protein KP79_PYT04682 [Mizuhopecten yessoensis]